MKIVNIHKAIGPEELLNAIRAKLNRLFKEQRQEEINFVSENKDGIVEIWQPELYEGFLFRIEIRGRELHITRSEDYIDDVNSLTVESILNEIFSDIAGDNIVSLVLEG